MCLHPRQRGWAAGAWRTGVLRGNKKTALRVREGRSGAGSGGARYRDKEDGGGGAG